MKAEIDPFCICYQLIQSYSAQQYILPFADNNSVLPFILSERGIYEFGFYILLPLYVNFDIL